MARPGAAGRVALAVVARLIAFALLVFLLSLALVTLLPWGRPASVAGELLVQGLVVLISSLLGGWLLLRFADRRPAGALGFAWTSRSAGEIGLGLAIGGIPLVATTAGLFAIGWIGYAPGSGTATDHVRSAVALLGILGVAAAAEEALFRGYAFQVLVRGIGAMPATALASGLFAVAHLGNPNASTFGMINIFLAGVLLSVAYLRTRSLWFATALHLGWNWSMASVLALPVSGLAVLGRPAYEAVSIGPELVTGGEFGPEGGLAGTVAFVLALLAVVRLRAVRPAREQAGLMPLVDGRFGDPAGMTSNSGENG